MKAVSCVILIVAACVVSAAAALDVLQEPFQGIETSRKAGSVSAIDARRILAISDSLQYPFEHYNVLTDDYEFTYDYYNISFSSLEGFSTLKPTDSLSELLRNGSFEIMGVSTSNEDELSQPMGIFYVPKRPLPFRHPIQRQKSEDFDVSQAEEQKLSADSLSKQNIQLLEKAIRKMDVQLSDPSFGSHKPDLYRFYYSKDYFTFEFHYPFRITQFREHPVLRALREKAAVDLGTMLEAKGLTDELQAALFPSHDSEYLIASIEDTLCDFMRTQTGTYHQRFLQAGLDCPEDDNNSTTIYEDAFHRNLEVVKVGSKKYLKQDVYHGSLCDLTGNSRYARVYYSCYSPKKDIMNIPKEYAKNPILNSFVKTISEGRLTDVKEVRTCQYEIYFEHKAFCEVELLQPDEKTSKPTEEVVWKVLDSIPRPMGCPVYIDGLDRFHWVNLESISGKFGYKSLSDGSTAGILVVPDWLSISANVANVQGQLAHLLRRKVTGESDRSVFLYELDVFSPQSGKVDMNSSTGAAPDSVYVWVGSLRVKVDRKGAHVVSKDYYASLEWKSRRYLPNYEEIEVYEPRNGLLALSLRGHQDDRTIDTAYTSQKGTSGTYNAHEDL